MKYEKSLTEVLQWKEEAGNILYNLTPRERLKIIREGAKKRLLQYRNKIIPMTGSNEKAEPGRDSESHPQHLPHTPS